MTTQPGDYPVHARVISFGETRQPGGTKWAFTEVECEVNGEAVTYSAISFVKEKLLAGQSYELLIRPNRQKAEHPEYEDRIQDVVATLPGDGSTAPPVAPKPKPQPQTQPQIPQPPRGFLPPDTASRWREFNTHARTASMNAKDMARIYADLVIAGRFDNEGEQVVVTKNMVQEWVTEEYGRYWINYGSYPPQDIYGDLFENSANKEAN